MQEKEQSPSVYGIGTDIIEIERIKLAIERHGQRFLDRIFTTHEKEYCMRYKYTFPHFAGRFAGKEAVVKALGYKEIAWHEIEIINDRSGKPTVTLSSRLEGLYPDCAIFLSISHCHEYATATAIVTKQAA